MEVSPLSTYDRTQALARVTSLRARLRDRWHRGVPRSIVAAVAAVDLGVAIVAGAVWQPLLTGTDGSAPMTPDTSPGTVIVSPSPVLVPGGTDPGGDGWRPPLPEVPAPSSIVGVPEGGESGTVAPEEPGDVATPEPTTPPSPPGSVTPPEPEPTAPPPEPTIAPSEPTQPRHDT